MGEPACPFCAQVLYKYPEYYYCYRCSKQFKTGLFGSLKEVPNTIQQDQRKALQKR